MDYNPLIQMRVYISQQQGRHQFALQVVQVLWLFSIPYTFITLNIYRNNQFVHDECITLRGWKFDEEKLKFIITKNVRDLGYGPVIDFKYDWATNRFNLNMSGINYHLTEVSEATINTKFKYIFDSRPYDWFDCIFYRMVGKVDFINDMC